jgi:GNAT superfamily N-acetyltransferase
MMPTSDRVWTGLVPARFDLSSKYGCLKSRLGADSGRKADGRLSAVYPFLLFAGLLLCGAVPLAPRSLRPALRRALRLSVLLCWFGSAALLWESVSRTSVALVSPGAVRRPHWVEQAALQALMLLGSLAGPSVVVTGLAAWALRDERRSDDREGVRSPPLLPAPAARARIALLEDSGDSTALLRFFVDSVTHPAATAALPANLLSSLRPPVGYLMIATIDGAPVGAAGARTSPDAPAELELLVVAPAHRRSGLGRRLVQAAAAEAQRRNGARLRAVAGADEAPFLALLRSLAFQEVPPWRDPEKPGATYLEKNL